MVDLKYGHLSRQHKSQKNVLRIYILRTCLMVLSRRDICFTQIY